MSRVQSEGARNLICHYLVMVLSRCLMYMPLINILKYLSWYEICSKNPIRREYFVVAFVFSTVIPIPILSRVSAHILIATPGIKM